jgi:uncharacterized membrane protein YgdD (TMEM256/DUF423 family)
MLAGLAGAAGVALAAAAAHRVDSPALATAATMLMIHASAAVALLAYAKSRAWIFAAATMLAAVSLFSGTIAINTLTGVVLPKLFAPVGGSLLIASWLGVAALAALEARRAR